MASYTQPRVRCGASSDQMVAVAANTICIIIPGCDSGGLPRNPDPGPEQYGPILKIHTQWVRQRPHLVGGRERLCP